MTSNPGYVPKTHYDRGAGYPLCGEARGRAVSYEQGAVTCQRCRQSLEIRAGLGTPPEAPAPKLEMPAPTVTNVMLDTDVSVGSWLTVEATSQTLTLTWHTGR
jgi:hypothetical protein